MRLGDLPPYAPAYPSSQEYLVYNIGEETTPGTPAVSATQSRIGGQGQTNADRGQPESPNPEDKNSKLERRRPISLDSGGSGPEETPGPSKPRPEPQEFRVVTVDKYGRIIIGDEFNSKMDIHEAQEMDLKKGENYHSNVTEKLNREYRTMVAALEKRNIVEHLQIGFDGHPQNTGCWIFGAGHGYVLPHQFNDSFQKARFITKIILLFFLCLVWRSIWLDQTILAGHIHDYLFLREAYKYPLLGSIVVYVFLSVLISLKGFEPYTRLLGVTVVLFVLQECVRTLCYVLFSLGCEFAVIMWYDTLDIFDDYNVTNPVDRNYWQRLNITPPIFLLIMAASISINIFTALCLETYTDMTLGTPEMFRVTILTSFMTFIVMVVLVKFYSVGVIPMWDGFQIVFATGLSIVKTWLFLYNLQRLVSGKITHLEGMGLKDVIFGLMLIC